MLGESELPTERRVPRRLLVRALLRAVLMTGFLVALYYLLPLDRASEGAAVVVLVPGLVVFAVLSGIQIRAILRADHPVLRAVNALATAVPLFLLLFASAYFLVSQAQPEAFTEPLSRTDALYFTVTVFATVGFGDIAPKTASTRILATVQMLGNLIVLGVFVRLVVGAVRTSQQRRVATTASRGAPAPPDVRPPEESSRSRGSGRSQAEDDAG